MAIVVVRYEDVGTLAVTGRVVCMPGSPTQPVSSKVHCNTRADQFPPATGRRLATVIMADSIASWAIRLGQNASRATGALQMKQYPAFDDIESRPAAGKFPASEAGPASPPTQDGSR